MREGALLRDVTDADLAVFFGQQLDPEANRMAAFTVEDPADSDAFDARWARILGDETIIKKTVLFDGLVAGSVPGFEQFGEPEVSYWIREGIPGQRPRDRGAPEVPGPREGPAPLRAPPKTT